MLVFIIIMVPSILLFYYGPNDIKYKDNSFDGFEYEVPEANNSNIIFDQHSHTRFSDGILNWINLICIYQGRSMMRKNSGFSAFELVIALAIMAVIAAFVTPQYLKWLRAYRLRGATTNLVADMEMAKIRAIRENSFVVVQFAADGYTIFVDNGEPSGTSGDWLATGEEVILRDRDMPAGVRIDLAEVDLDNNRTRFNGRGVPPDITGPEIIPITNSIDKKEITINRLGYMNVH